MLDVGHTLAVPGAISARGVPEYMFNLQLAETMQQALIAAGFDKTVRLITATAPWPGLRERAARANGMHADLFIAIHHDSVPDELLETWQYEGKENHFSDRFSGYAIFVSNDNADRAGSLAFGRFLGKELESRGLHYTPHYTLPLMGRHRHELLDADAGVYRYDQLHGPAGDAHAGGAAGGRLNRQPAGGAGAGNAGTPPAHRAGRRRRGREFLHRASAGPAAKSMVPARDHRPAAVAR